MDREGECRAVGLGGWHGVCVDGVTGVCQVFSSGGVVCQTRSCVRLWYDDVGGSMDVRGLWHCSQAALLLVVQ